MKVRAKFTVAKVSEMGYEGSSGPYRRMCYRDGKETDVPQREITMGAVYGTDGENASFSEATPTGSITFLLNNPDLKDEFKPGQTYYVDFTPVPAKG